MRIAHLPMVPALAAALLAAGVAHAEPKIAVISTPALLQQAPQIKAADGKLKAEFEKREKDLKAEGKKLEEDIGKFRREADTMSPQQRTNAQNDLNTRRTDFDLKQRKLSEEVQSRNGELQREVLDTIGRAIEAVAREQGVDIVVRDPAYVSDGYDITGEVLRKLAAMGDGGDDKKKKKK